MVWRYPSNSFSNTSSSFLILFAIINGYTKKIINDIKEPKTNGINKNNKIEYIEL